MPIRIKHERLREAAKKEFGSQAAFARALGVTHGSVNGKFTGYRQHFTLPELGKWCELLHLQPGDILEHIREEDDFE